MSLGCCCCENQETEAKEPCRLGHVRGAFWMRLFLLQGFCTRPALPYVSSECTAPRCTVGTLSPYAPLCHLAACSLAVALWAFAGLDHDPRTYML